MGRRVGRLGSLAAVGSLVASGCLGQGTPSEPRLDDAEHRILFIGNSLTYSNDLPGAVATIAGALGYDVAVAATAFPDFALEDHWNRGVADIVRSLRPDVVVMQQGPSSLPANQLHLATWAETIAEVVDEVDGRSAMLMVWPSLAREHAFDDVRDSYLGAAERVGGLFIPAGEAFRALRESMPDTSPFGPDGFHPSEVGTVAVAYVVVGAVFDDSVQGLDARLPAANGGRPVSLDEETAGVVQAAADSVVAAWR